LKHFFILTALFVALALTPFTCFAEKTIIILYAGDILGQITHTEG